jgi:hypothetical protein
MIPILCDNASSEIAVEPHEKLILWGVVASETASPASTAEFILRHGTDGTGDPILTPANFASDGFMPPIFFPHPITCQKGIYIDRVSGRTTVILYIDYQ